MYYNIYVLSRCFEHGLIIQWLIEKGDYVLGIVIMINCYIQLLFCKVVFEK